MDVVVLAFSSAVRATMSDDEVVVIAVSEILVIGWVDVMAIIG